MALAPLDPLPKNLHTLHSLTTNPLDKPLPPHSDPHKKKQPKDVKHRGFFRSPTRTDSATLFINDLHKIPSLDFIQQPSTDSKVDIGNKSTLSRKKPGLRERLSAKKKLACCLQPLKHLGPAIALFLYTIIGAAIFRELELKNEIAVENEKKKKLHNLIANICLTALNSTDYGTTDKKFDILSSCESAIEPSISIYMKQYLRGFDGDLRNWDFEGAAFFAITVYTTIGYGRATPVTVPGRVTTIIYAMIGIPLNFFVLADMGILLNKGLRHLWRKGSAYFEKTKVKQSSTDNEQNGGKPAVKKRKKALPIWIPVLTSYLYLFMGALMFMNIEPSWNFLTSLYFCFQTFATIGFGDVMPDNRDNMMKSSVYILVGMALLSMCMAVITDNIKKHYAKYSKHLDILEQPPQAVNGTKDKSAAIVETLLNEGDKEQQVKEDEKLETSNHPDLFLKAKSPDLSRDEPKDCMENTSLENGNGNKEEKQKTSEKIIRERRKRTKISSGLSKRFARSISSECSVSGESTKKNLNSLKI